jgi:hypothetical protein
VLGVKYFGTQVVPSSSNTYGYSRYNKGYYGQAKNVVRTDDDAYQYSYSTPTATVARYRRCFSQK